MKGERFKLEQMFINRLDNALKYTDKGKISVAIVKHVVLMHKGEIAVENVKGEGTVFTILFPVA
jgi:signal transduction histidine kinase